MLPSTGIYVGVLTLLIPILVHLVHKRRIDNDHGKVVYNHSPGPCRMVSLIEQGAVDIEHIGQGMVLFTAGMKKYDNLHWPNFIDRRGKVYLFNLNKPLDKPSELKITGTFNAENFNPQGLSTWVDSKTGVITVFIVNHVLSTGVHIRSDIEKFRFDSEKLTLDHLKTIQQDSNFMHLVDLVATSESTFYLPNFEYYRKKPYPYLEQGYYGYTFEWGTLLHYDGKNSTVVAGKYNKAYGIALSLDKRFLYLGVAGTKELKIYKIKQDTILSLHETFNLGVSPAHMNVDYKTGDLWIATHPVLHKYEEYLDDPHYPCPSQVLQVKMKDGNITSIKEVFSDDGRTLKGSSVAVRYGDGLLIGTQHHKLLYCEIRSFPVEL